MKAVNNVITVQAELFIMDAYILNFGLNLKSTERMSLTR